MARRSKSKPSPYDDSAGRGTGDYLAQAPSTKVERVSGPGSMSIGKKELLATQPDSSLVGALLATLFCFPPLGIFAIIYALQVRYRWKRGNEAGAKHAAAMAEKLTFASVGLFVIIFGIGLVVYVFYWFFGRHQV